MSVVVPQLGELSAKIGATAPDKRLSEILALRGLNLTDVQQIDRAPLRAWMSHRNMLA